MQRRSRLLEEAGKASERAKARHEQGDALAASGGAHAAERARTLHEEGHALDRAARYAERQYARTAAPATPTVVIGIAWLVGAILFVGMAAAEVSHVGFLDVAGGMYSVAAITYGAFSWRSFDSFARSKRDQKALALDAVEPGSAA